MAAFSCRGLNKFSLMTQNMGASASLLHIKADHCLSIRQNCIVQCKAACKPVIHWDSTAQGPAPINSLGYAECDSLLQLECRCGRKGLLHASFPMLICIFYHTGSRNPSCPTFLVCSDGMKSHRPGQKDHDGNCPYVEIRSCNLATRKIGF